MKFSQFTYQPIEPATLATNGETVMIKQYLPIDQKLTMVANILNQSMEQDKRYFNVGKIEVFKTIELILNYSDIEFAPEELDNPATTFDKLTESGLAADVINIIPMSEILLINDLIDVTMNEISKYNNSALGILDAVSQDYSNLQLDAEKIHQDLADGKNVEFLKDVMDKLG